MRWLACAVAFLLVGCMDYRPPDDDPVLDVPAAAAIAETDDKTVPHPVQEQATEPSYKLVWPWTDPYVRDDEPFAPFVVLERHANKPTALPTGDRIVWTLLDAQGTLVHRQVGWSLDPLRLEHGTYSVQVAAYRQDGRVVDHVTLAILVGQRAYSYFQCGALLEGSTQCPDVALPVPQDARRLVVRGWAGSVLPPDELRVLDGSGRIAASGSPDFFGAPVLVVSDMQVHDLSQPWVLRWMQGPASLGPGWVETVLWTGVTDRNPDFPVVDLRVLPPMPAQVLQVLGPWGALCEAIANLFLVWDCSGGVSAVVSHPYDVPDAPTGAQLSVHAADGRRLGDLPLEEGRVSGSWIPKANTTWPAGFYWVQARATGSSGTLASAPYPLAHDGRALADLQCVAVPAPLATSGCPAFTFLVPQEAKRVDAYVDVANSTLPGRLMVLDAAGNEVPTWDTRYDLAQGRARSALHIDAPGEYTAGNWTLAWQAAPGTTPSVHVYATVDVQWSGGRPPTLAESGA